MADKKIKATAQLFLDVSDAQSDAKKFVTDLKKQLSSIETAADKITVFKDLVGYIELVDKALSVLRAKNGDAFKHMFDGMDENFRKEFEELFGLSGGNLSKLDVLREKLATLTPKSSIKEVRKFAQDLSSLYTAIGQTPDFKVEDFAGRTNADFIRILTDAFNKFDSLWANKVSELKDKFSIGESGGNFSERVQKEIEGLQNQISELKALRKELDSVLQAKKDYDNFKSLGLEFDISQTEELINKYKELESVSGNYQKGTKEYYDNLAQRAKIGLQLSMAQDSEQLNPEHATAIRKIIGSDSFDSMLSEFQSEFKNISAIYDQAIEKIQQKIQDIKTKAATNNGQGDGRQLLKTYEELLKIVDKIAALGESLDFDDESIQKLVSDLKELYATEEQASQVDDILKNLTTGAILSSEALGQLKNIFGIEIPESVQTASQKIEAFYDRIDAQQALGLESEFSAGEYQSKMELLKSELQDLYEQGRITEDQFNQIQDAFNRDVKEYVDVFIGRNNTLKELNELNKAASQTTDEKSLEGIVQKRREIITLAEQNGTLLAEQLAEEKAITDEIEKRIGAKKQDNADSKDENANGQGSQGGQTSDEAEQENEAYQRLLETIREVKSAIDAKTEAFREEATTVDSVVEQEIGSLEKLNQYLNTLKATMQSVFSGNNKKIGFHYGNLEHYIKTGEKSENFKYQGDSLRTGNWGSFGTGIYYLTNPNAFVGSDTVPQGQLKKDQKFYAIDLSKYNLYMAQTSEQAENLYNFLNKLQKFVLSASNYRGFDEELQGVNVDTLYQEFQNVFKDVSLPIETLQNFVSKMRSMVAGLDIDKNWATFENVDEVLGGSDNIPTRFMKSLGYQGVDTSGTSWDKLQYGSVIYDLDQANAYFKEFSSLNELLEYYNQNLNQSGTMQNELNNAIDTLNRSLVEITETINGIPATVGDISSALQPILDAIPDIATAIGNLESALNGISENLTTQDLQPTADTLSQMAIDAQTIKNTLDGIGGDFGMQGDSTLNVKFGDTLKVDLTSDSTGLLISIQDAVAAIQTKINAQNPSSRQTKVDAMKNNLTQLFKYVSDFNARKINTDYQQQEISAAILSDGSIATGFGEDGTVPWDRMASALVANLTKSLLVDLHSHPWETGPNGEKLANDVFSTADGDIGAFSFSKQLGAQIAAMITGNIMHTLDLSQLNDFQMAILQNALEYVEKNAPENPKYSKYFSREESGEVSWEWNDPSLASIHEAMQAVDNLLYDAFEMMGLSKDYVDQNILKEYDLTDDKQLTDLAERLVDLALASQNALSPVERLAQIVSQFGGDINSAQAKTAFEGFKKGELSAADVFNQLNGNGFTISQDTMDSLFTIDSANEMSTVESLLTQITGTLEAIKSNVSNIDGNTSRNTSEQIDKAISDIIDVRDAFATKVYGDIDKRLINDKRSNVDPLNISEYKNQEMFNAAQNRLDNFKYLLDSIGSDDIDIAKAQTILNSFKETWRALDDAIATVKLYEKRTGNEAISEETGEVLRGSLYNMINELFDSPGLNELLRILNVAKTQIDTAKSDLYQTNTGDDTSSLVQTLTGIQGTLDQIYGVLQGFTGIESDNKNSIQQKEPAVDSPLNQSELSEQDLSVLNSILEAIREISNYLTTGTSNLVPDEMDQDNNTVSNIYALLSSRLSQNLASENTLNEIQSLISLLSDKVNADKDINTEIDQGSNYALESTLQVVKGVLDQIVSKMDFAQKDGIEGVDTNVAPPDNNTNLDQQSDSGYALESTLQSVQSVLNNILAAISSNEAISAFVQPLSDAVSALKDVANGIIKHQEAQKTGTSAAMAKIADHNQYKQISDIAANSVGNLGSEVQIKSLKALANGVVQVEGAFKNAQNQWEGFTVNVNESNVAVDLAINKQSAYAKALNQTSEALKQQKIQDNAKLNTIAKQSSELYKSLKINPLDTSDSANAVRGSYAQLTEELEKYKKKQTALTEDELNGLRQIYAQLMANAQAYAEQNKSADKTKKKTYGTNVMTTATSKHNALMSAINGDASLAIASTTQGNELQAKLAEYESAYAKLEAVYNRLKTINPTENDQAEFKNASAACNNLRKEVEGLIKSYQKMHNGENVVNKMGLDDDFVDDALNRAKALQDYVESMYGAKAQIGDFKNNYHELLFTINNGDGTFTEAKVAIDNVGRSLVETAGDTKIATSKWGSFVNELKGKFRSITTYLMSMTGIQEVWQQIRQGVQYVREIDTALTELKKVTNETGSTYDAFLQTMSKTAGNVGSTVSELTTMAAEWARLGYNIEDAGKLAESTAILLNVSEFSDATEASQALISTMQAFGYVADDSQHVVDILNEVGKLIAPR